MSGGSVRLRCSVPHHPEHRWLEMGIDGYTSSLREVEGEDAPITHEMVITHIPCLGAVTTAFCVVTKFNRSQERALATLVVGGCS